jgi:hypothetical protein
MTDFYNYNPFAGVNPFAGIGDNSVNPENRVYNTSATGEVGPYINADRWGIPDNQFSYGAERSVWDSEQTKKRQYWQDLLGNNYDESALGALSDAPKAYDPYAISAADQRAYVYGASPQNAQGMPWSQAGIGWGEGGGNNGSSYGVGKQFTGTRPGWQDMQGNAAPMAPGEGAFQGRSPSPQGWDPMSNLTGKSPSDPTDKSPGYWAPYIQQQQSPPSSQNQLAHLQELITLMRL